MSERMPKFGNPEISPPMGVTYPKCYLFRFGIILSLAVGGVVKKQESKWDKMGTESPKRLASQMSRAYFQSSGNSGEPKSLLGSSMAERNGKTL
jgi:hypothetical protein